MCFQRNNLTLVVDSFFLDCFCVVASSSLRMLPVMSAMLSEAISAYATAILLASPVRLISGRCVHQELKLPECNPVLRMPSQNSGLTILVEQSKPKVSLVDRCGNPQLQLVFHSIRCSEIVRWAWFERSRMYQMDPR